jgi:catechol 2,3-dioxygenase-like lactoylglutathione lyase family enzyme
MDLVPYVDANHQLVIEVYVRDLTRSISFYEGFGFKVGRREEHFAQLSWDGHDFFLDEQSGLPQTAGLPQVNVRVLVPDVDIYWNRALEMGVKIISPVGDRSYGLRDFIISDPDGFGLRFATPLNTP